jgi:hypothetical protein
MLLLTLALAAATPHASMAPETSASCDITRALYVAAGEPQYRLSFERLPHHEGVIGDLALHIRAPSPAGELWYYFDQGTIPRVALISSTDPMVPGWRPDLDGRARPHGDLTYVGLTADGQIAASAPTSRSAPPRFVVIPELAETYLHIEPNYLPAAFVFSGCAS